MSSLLPGPYGLVLSLERYCCSLVTLEQEDHRQGTQGRGEKEREERRCLLRGSGRIDSATGNRL